MKRTILSCLLLIACSTSLAGVKEVGNGGGLWVCRDSSSNQIHWMRLVDLFEAEAEFKLNLSMHTGRSYTEILDLTKIRIFKTNKGLFSDLEQYIDTVERNKIMVNADLEMIDDALFRIRPPQSSCVNGDISYVQFGNYTNYGAILIRQDLWQSISELDKAALIVHEAIYAYFRQRYNQTNSVQTRIAVGYIFSNLEIDLLKEKLNPLFTVKPPPSPAPSEFTQKYFTIGERYRFDTRNSNCGEPTSGVVILDGNEKNGWKIQVGVQGSRDCQGSQARIDLNRQLGPKTWSGNSQMTVTLKNGMSCSFPVSANISFGKSMWGDGRSKVDFEFFYPIVAGYYQNCRDVETRQYIYTVELGK